MNIEIVKKAIQIESNYLNPETMKDLTDSIIDATICQEDYHLTNIIEDKEVIESEQIMLANSYHLKPFKELVEIAGYERINNAFMKIMKRRSKNGKPSKE